MSLYQLDPPRGGGVLSYLELSVTRDPEKCAVCEDYSRMDNPLSAIVALNGDVALLTLEKAARRSSVKDLPQSV